MNQRNTSAETKLPKARTSGLIIENSSDEIVLYDEHRRKAHCLNSTAAAIWRRCDGHTTIKEMTEQLGRQLPVDVAADVIRATLADLSSKHLLDGVEFPPLANRRELFKRAALMTGVILLPLIASVSIPSRADAASPPP